MVPNLPDYPYIICADLQEFPEDRAAPIGNKYRAVAEARRRMRQRMSETNFYDLWFCKTDIYYSRVTMFFGFMDKRDLLRWRMMVDVPVRSMYPIELK